MWAHYETNRGEKYYWGETGIVFFLERKFGIFEALKEKSWGFKLV
jgi:hypothetical protein